jgi:NAD(P)-dependent dehydrogenase (short-subunit alcohol dehydrogenase family)
MRRQRGGSIINISSISGLRPNPGSGVYNTSKAALQMMSQTMALETAGDNIRINVIAPGAVEDTELGDAAFGKDNAASFYPRLAALHPMGRNGKPEDIAEAALFLASRLSSWITGAILPVDGGRHMIMNTLNNEK